MKNKDINVIISENQKISFEGVVTPTYKDNERYGIVSSDRRIIELSRKGIFACPKYIDLFINIDDALMK